MAIADYATYKSKISAPYQRIQDTKWSVNTVAGRLHSLWVTTPFGGTVPTSAAAVDNSLTGSMGQQNSSGVQRLAQVSASLGAAGCLIIADRLSHQGGLDATVITTQTTNLPTAALTRHTSGEGVWIALEIYTIIGSSGTTVSASYTNQAGTSGRTTPAVVLGGTGFREANRVMLLPLETGDTGARSVESLTVAATTGTAGNFGVTLIKPLCMMPMPNIGSQQMLFDSVQSLGCYMPQIVNDAHLFYLFVANTTFTGVLANAVRIIEE